MKSHIDTYMCIPLFSLIFYYYFQQFQSYIGIPGKKCYRANAFSMVDARLLM